MKIKLQQSKNQNQNKLIKNLKYVRRKDNIKEENYLDMFGEISIKAG